MRYTIKMECKAYRVKRDVDRIDSVIVGRRKQARGWGYPWIARITGYHWRWKFKREFLRPTIDKSEANSVESRGVFYYWHLSDGIYEVSTDSGQREYCAVQAGDCKLLTEDEVELWLASDH